MVLLETGLMGLVAGLLAMPTGYALALILVYVINRRSFGWTLQIAAGSPAFRCQALAGGAGGRAAGRHLPGLRLSRMPAAEAIRYE